MERLADVLKRLVKVEDLDYHLNLQKCTLSLAAASVKDAEEAARFIEEQTRAEVKVEHNFVQVILDHFDDLSKLVSVLEKLHVGAKRGF